MKSKNKVVVIGLDGGTLDLMLPWIQQGKLPTFSKIVKKGVHGKLRSTTPYYSAPAWVSAVTGCQPGKHGIYDFFRTDTINKNIVNSKLRKVPAVWNILTDVGKKSLVINVPGSYPPEKINGTMITGLLTPSLESEFTYPKDIKKALTKDQLGEYLLEQVAIDDIPKNLTAKHAPEKLANQTNQTTKSHAIVTMNLMKKHDWDFTMVVFRGTDDVQHLLWQRKDLVFDCYKKADEYIGEMMSKYPDAVFIIISDHGFGQPEKYFHVNNALFNAGYLKITTHPIRNFGTLSSMFLSKMSKIIYLILPVQKLVRTPIVRKLILTSSISRNIDLSKSKALFHSICSRGIRINLKGKFKEGIVEKEDYDKLRTELISFLKNIKDPETGENIVKKVNTFEEIYGPDAVNDPLDIIFDLNEKYGAQELIQEPKEGIRSIFKFDKKELSIVSKPGFYEWVGDHRPNGIIFMYGDNIKKNHKIHTSIVDIAPTVLSILETPIPDYMDGKVIDEAFIKKPKVTIEKSYSLKRKTLSKGELDKIKKLSIDLL